MKLHNWNTCTKLVWHPSCSSQNLFLRMPSLGLNSPKKQVSHTTNLHYCINEERKIVSKSFLTTKENLNIVASKSLITSISSWKNKSEIRSVLEKRWKKKSSINNIHDAERLPCATICQIGSQKTWAQEIVWSPIEQQIHSTSWAKTQE
jgi:hypothetical protein